MLRIRCSIFVVGVVSRLDRGNNTQNSLFYTCDRCCQQTRQRKQYLEFVVLYLWQVLSVDQIGETILRILCSILVVGVVSRLDRGNNTQNPLFYTCDRCCQQTRQRKQYLESFVLFLWQMLSVDQIEETMLRILCSILVVDVVSRLDRGNNAQSSLFQTCGRCCQQTRQRKQYLEFFVLYLWQMLSVDQIDRGNNTQNSLFYTCGRCCQQTRQRKQYLEFFVLYLWQVLSVDQIDRGNNTQNSLFYTCGRCCQQTRQIGETILRILCSILVVGVVSRLDRGNNSQNPLFYTCGRCCQQTRQRKNSQNPLFYTCGRCCQQTRQRNNTQNPLFYTCGRRCQQTRQRKQFLESFVLYLWQVLLVDQIEETILRILCSILVVGVVSRLDRGNNSQNPLFYTCGRCCQQTRQRKQYLGSFVLYLWQVFSVDQIEETILRILCSILGVGVLVDQIEETMLRILCSILVVGVFSRLDRGNNAQNSLFYSCGRCFQQTRQRKQCL